MVLTGSHEDLVKALQGVDVVVSAIGPAEQLEQIPLATAAKEAGVKRFIPCGFITVSPPGGIMALRDAKEVVYNHIRQLYLVINRLYRLHSKRLLLTLTSSAIHFPGRRLVVPNLLPSSTLWQDRLRCRLPR